MLRRPVALQAPGPSALRLMLVDDFHLVHRTMARIAAHPPVHMNRMVEIGVVRNIVDLHPVDRRPVALPAIDAARTASNLGLCALTCWWQLMQVWTAGTFECEATSTKL